MVYREMRDCLGAGYSQSSDDAVHGICSTQFILHLVYTGLGVRCTWCMLYSVYTALSVNS